MKFSQLFSSFGSASFPLKDGNFLSSMQIFVFLHVLFFFSLLDEEDLPIGQSVCLLI